MQKTQELQGNIPNVSICGPFAKPFVATMHSMVKQCIVNQIKGYMLLSNALNVALFISVFMHNVQFKVNFMC
jgi:hypothetical protein